MQISNMMLQFKSLTIPHTQMLFFRQTALKLHELFIDTELNNFINNTLDAQRVE